jgi:hypothetical protein
MHQSLDFANRVFLLRPNVMDVLNLCFLVYKILYSIYERRCKKIFIGRPYTKAEGSNCQHY